MPDTDLRDLEFHYLPEVRDHAHAMRAVIEREILQDTLRRAYETLNPGQSLSL
jgi:hypothetical protein